MLQYAEAPQIDPRERHVEVAAGNDLHLHCSAYGTPEPEIKWTRKTAGGYDAKPVESVSSLKKIIF